MNKLLAALGLIVLSAFAAAPAQSADFSFSQSEKAIYMTGLIEEGDYFKFLLAAHDAGKDFKYIVMTSPGGAFYDSLAIGQFIRAQNIAAVAKDNCHSGCAYIWLSSPMKMVDGIVGAYVSIHMPYSIIESWSGRKMSDAKSVKQAKDYLKMIGLPAAAVTKIGEALDGDNFWLSPDVIAEWGLLVMIYLDDAGVAEMKKHMEEAAAANAR